MKARLQGSEAEITITDPAHVADPVWFASNVLDFTHVPTGKPGRAWITKEQWHHFANAL